MSAAGPSVDPGTLDALAGVAAIAVERAHFLEERKAAELERQRAELASAVLASFSHDLRTPFTAIQVAVANLVDPEISKEEREGQADVALREVHRLRRLFQFILDMAQVDAGISPEREWILAQDVVDAAEALAAQGLAEHRVEVDADSEREVEVDPRLTSGALAHVLENAAQHSAVGSVIRVRAWVDEEGLHVSVLDQGPGLDPASLPRLFDPFYRGVALPATPRGSGSDCPSPAGSWRRKGVASGRKTRRPTGPVSPSSCPPEAARRRSRPRGGRDPAAANPHRGR